MRPGENTSKSLKIPQTVSDRSGIYRKIVRPVAVQQSSAHLQVPMPNHSQARCHNVSPARGAGDNSPLQKLASPDRCRNLKSRSSSCALLRRLRRAQERCQDVALWNRPPLRTYGVPVVRLVGLGPLAHHFPGGRKWS